MRTSLVVLFLLLSSVGTFATSSGVAVQGGFFDYDPAYGIGSWTPRMMGLNVGGYTPNQIPFTFSSSNLTVTCAPACAVGDTFTFNLSMTGFADVKYGSAWSGTLNFLTTHPLTITPNGVDIARFVLTGDLTGCYYPVNCIDITPNLHGYATVTYALVGGQLQVTSVSYSLPEPATVILLATGLFGTGLARRRKSARAHGLPEA
jgi:PEP-CTERM motif